MIRPLPARRAAGLALAAAMLLGACSDDEAPPAASPTTTTDATSPTPTPTWTVRPVVGERSATVLPLGPRPLVGLGANPEPDQAAIDAAVDATGDWLDAHLDALQRTGSGVFGQVAAPGLANPKERRPVTTGLTNPDAPVASARYVMSVYHDGPPRYLTARVEVHRVDDTVAETELVLLVDEDGSLTLTMFGPPPTTEVAS